MNKPMYTTQAELKQVLSLKPDGYPIPYYPDLERKEPIDVHLWYRFPHMDLIFGTGAKDHPFKENFDAFYELRLRDDKDQIVGGKRYYLDKASLLAMFSGISILMDKNELLNPYKREEVERELHSMEPDDEGK